MAKDWKLQDIKPPERQRRPRRTASSEQARAHRGEQEANTSTTGGDGRSRGPRTRNVSDSRKRRRKTLLGIGVVIVVVVAGFGVSSLLRGVEVRVYPKFEDVNIDATFTSAAEPEAGQLGHELLTLEETAQRTTTASGEEEVSEQAEGTIIIYNEYSTSPQRLIKNTRFESPEGLIFKIPESVEVPGYTENESGEIVPGTLTTEVFAESPGEQYNIGPTRFSIPGLEGTDQYEAMYATSDTSFSGGYEGPRFIVAEDTLANIRTELRDELRQRLLERLPNERPAGFELFENAVTFSFESLPHTRESGEAVLVRERARLMIPLFKDEEFAAYIAENTVAGYESRPVRIEDTSDITFTYPSTSTSPSAGEGEVTFLLRGDARLVWTFDKEQLRSDLAGKQKTALPSVLSGYPAIVRAEATIRPFWKQSFPGEPDSIEIVEILQTRND